jgi:hypothetical protein
MNKVSDHVRDYVAQRLKEGDSEQHIRQVLETMGVTSREIDAAFSQSTDKKQEGTGFMEDLFQTSLEKGPETRASFKDKKKPFGVTEKVNMPSPTSIPSEPKPLKVQDFSQVKKPSEPGQKPLEPLKEEPAKPLIESSSEPKKEELAPSKPVREKPSPELEEPAKPLIESSSEPAKKEPAPSQAPLETPSKGLKEIEFPTEGPPKEKVVPKKPVTAPQEQSTPSPKTAAPQPSKTQETGELEALGEKPVEESPLETLSREFGQTGPSKTVSPEEMQEAEEKALLRLSRETEELEKPIPPSEESSVLDELVGEVEQGTPVKRETPKPQKSGRDLDLLPSPAEYESKPEPSKPSLSQTKPTPSPPSQAQPTEAPAQPTPQPTRRDYQPQPSQPTPQPRQSQLQPIQTQPLPREEPEVTAAAASEVQEEPSPEPETEEPRFSRSTFIKVGIAGFFFLIVVAIIGGVALMLLPPGPVNNGTVGPIEQPPQALFKSVNVECREAATNTDGVIRFYNSDVESIIPSEEDLTIVIENHTFRIDSSEPIPKQSETVYSVEDLNRYSDSFNDASLKQGTKGVVFGLNIPVTDFEC